MLTPSHRPNSFPYRHLRPEGRAGRRLAPYGVLPAPWRPPPPHAGPQPQVRHALAGSCGTRAPAPSGAGNTDHRDLDQVRSRTLEGGVGGGPLAKRANVVVAVLELRYVAPPSEQCLDIPPLAGLGHRAIEPGPDPGEAGEVLLDESFRVILGDAELAGESERPLPVDRGEVDRLGAGSRSEERRVGEEWRSRWAPDP